MLFSKFNLYQNKKPNNVYKTFANTYTTGNRPKKSNYLLYGITDSKLNNKYGRTMLESVKEAVRGGCTTIQLREKEANDNIFITFAKELVNEYKDTNINIIINNRADIMVATEADGVHVGQNDIPVKLIRKIIGPDKIIGVSVCSLDQAYRAVDDGANYLGVGPVFYSITKNEEPPVGIKVLEDICMAVPIPVVAIGGLTIDNISQITDCKNIAGVALIKQIFDNNNIFVSTLGLKYKLQK